MSRIHYTIHCTSYSRNGKSHVSTKGNTDITREIAKLPFGLGLNSRERLSSKEEKEGYSRQKRQKHSRIDE